MHGHGMAWHGEIPWPQQYFWCPVTVTECVHIYSGLGHTRTLFLGFQGPLLGRKRMLSDRSRRKRREPLGERLPALSPAIFDMMGKFSIFLEA